MYQLQHFVSQNYTLLFLISPYINAQDKEHQRKKHREDETDSDRERRRRERKKDHEVQINILMKLHDHLLKLQSHTVSSIATITKRYAIVFYGTVHIKRRQTSKETIANVIADAVC